MTKTGNKKERELITRSANPKQSNENRNFKNDYQKMKRLISKIEYQTADKYWVKHSEKKSKIAGKDRS